MPIRLWFISLVVSSTREALPCKALDLDHVLVGILILKRV